MILKVCNLVWKLFLTFCNCVKISSFATLRLFLQKCHASHSSVMCAKVTLTYNNNSNYQITIGNSIDLLREQKPNLVSLVKTVNSRFCCAILRTNNWDAIYWVQQNGRGVEWDEICFIEHVLFPNFSLYLFSLIWLKVYVFNPNAHHWWVGLKFLYIIMHLIFVYSKKFIPEVFWSDDVLSFKYCYIPFSLSMKGNI